ncbi:elongator complex protein 3 [Patescibacteria group bacterium]
MNTNELVIQELIKNRVKTQVDLAKIKRNLAKKYKISCPSNVELLKVYHKLLEDGRLKTNKNLERVLRIRSVRSLSGIVNVSVLTKPYPCPGKCLYCPSQKGIPKSYLDGEPAVMRAILNKFNPYLQVKNRVLALENTGHPTDKIELRIIGGTWSFYPKTYQTWFIKRCFDACNRKDSKNFKKAQILNEKAKHRIIGITIETRPDFIDEIEIKKLRKLGVTRAELGVQTIYNDVLKINNRGHGIEATIKATKLLKDAGFKICYQIMPNLPGSNLKKDERVFKELFSDSNFQPDLLKIYPTALLKKTPLLKLWKEKKYRPYDKKELTSLLKSIKKKIPHYVRIQRIIRDFPSFKIAEGGTKVSNLRQVVVKEMEKENLRCNCIRCREVKENYDPKDKLFLFRQDYEASGGKEIFLSFEDKKRNKLYSLLRLRIPSHFFSKEKHFLEVLRKAAIIREVHTYGQLHSLQERFSRISPQHKGLGKKMIKEAEKISKKEFGIKKIAVISGVGARNYFRQLKYELRDGYMIKNLKK